jgi:hypothetical protein
MQTIKGAPGESIQWEQLQMQLPDLQPRCKELGQGKLHGINQVDTAGGAQ